MNAVKDRLITILIMVLAGVAIVIAVILWIVCNLDKENRNEGIYVSEYISVDIGKKYFQNVQVSGDSVYFLFQNICRYSVADRQCTTVLFNWQSDNADREIENFYVFDDYSIYLVVKENAGRYVLYKFDAQGRQVFSQDIAVQREDELNGIGVDPRGRIYIGNGTKVLLYDEWGEADGYISLEGKNAEIFGIWNDSEGNMCAGYYEGSNLGFYDIGNFELAELDFENKEIIAAYSGSSLGSSNVFIPGINDNFLVYDSIGVYDYNMKNQTKSLVFEWLECNIDGIFVKGIGWLADGRLAVFYDDWPNNERGIFLVSKAERDQLMQKEEIVVATMYYNSWLQRATLNFNRTNDKYKVVIRQYVENGSSGAAALSDALVKLNNDLMSSDCPDIIDLSELDVDQMAMTNILEDLMPYLKASSHLSPADFLENILDEYTIGGSLAAIPYKFTVCTVIGSLEKIGHKSGWTIDEIMDFANVYSESELFGEIEKSEILQYLMMCDEDRFVNWQAGECNFNSKQFKDLLEFVNSLPDVEKQNTSGTLGVPLDVDTQDGKVSKPARIQNGEVLLDIEEYIYDFNTIQMCKEMFQEDIVCIGFPSFDGTGGHILYPINIYGITTKSNCKEGAWSFIEYLLLQEESGINQFGFPTRKTELEAMVNRTLNFGFLVDEEGDLLLDENGRPIENAEQLPISVSKGGWSYTYRRTTQDEIEIMLAVLTKAKRISGKGNEIIQIVTEEANGYFMGQRTLEDVTNNIQSRVGIYIGENR